MGYYFNLQNNESNRTPKKPNPFSSESTICSDENGNFVDHCNDPTRKRHISTFLNTICTFLVGEMVNLVNLMN